MTASVLTACIVLLHLLGAFAALHAMMHTRTPQGAIGWVLGLVLLPYLTLLPYLYLGSSRFLDYYTRRPPQPTASRLIEHDNIEADPGCARFSAITALQGRAFRGGHQVQLLIDGPTAFDAMLAAMAGAQQLLLVQFFIIRDDGLGQRLQQVLLERARAGVQVRVLFDSIGSRGLSRQYIDTLRQGGVAIRPFATRRWRNRFQLNFRNHRKIVVVDGSCAFVGGLNVGDEYLGLKPPLAPWRDTQLALRGPALADLQQRFAEDWHWITGESLTLPPATPCGGTASALVVASGPADAQETGSLLFTAAIHAARERVWLSSPYFVPDQAVRSALQLAVLRGVDVRVLVPCRPDHRTVFLASSLHLHDAVRAGVRAFRFQPGFLHQKALLIDRDTAMIGSFNLDGRSFRLNFEVAALVVDVAFAAEVSSMLRSDLALAREINLNDYRNASWPQRVLMHLARLFDPLL